MTDPAKPTYAQAALKGKEIQQENKEKLFTSIDCVRKAVSKAQKTGEPFDVVTTGGLKGLNDELSLYFLKKQKKMLQILQNWTSEKRISFYCEVAIRLEYPEDDSNSQEYSNLLTELDKIEVSTIGKGAGYENTLQQWDERIDAKLLNKMKEFSSYNYKSVRHLVRFIRNLNNHHSKLPLDIKPSVRPYEHMDRYFTIRFPGLLAEVYKAVSKTCQKKDCFDRYFD